MRKKKVFNLLYVGAVVLMVGATSIVSSCTGVPVDVDRELPSDDPSSVKKIVFWECLGHDKETNLNQIVNEFNEKYEGKYQVEAMRIAGDYDSLHSTVKTRLAANEVPALCMGYPDSFSEYISQDIGSSSILRIDNYINDKNFGYTQEELDDFVPEFLAEGSNYQFEGTWSMPMYKSTEIAYYNANYFSGDNPQTQKKLANDSKYNTLRADVAKDANKVSDAKLKALKEYTTTACGYTYDVPTTWDEMRTLGEKMLADRKAEGITDEFYPLGYDSDANMFISQFAQRGIDYTSNTGSTPEAKILFNNDKAKEFLQEVVDMVKEGVLITKATLGGSKYTNEYFNNGKAALVIGSTGGSSYNVSANYKVSLAPVPYSGETPKYIMQGPSICFFNNEDEYIHKGAWLFYKELAETTNNTELALENSYDPVRQSSFETEDYKNFISKHDVDLKYDIPYHTKDLREDYMTSPVFIGSSTARTEIGNLLTYVIGNGLSIDDAFNQAYNKTIQATK